MHSHLHTEIATYILASNSTRFNLILALADEASAKKGSCRIASQLVAIPVCDISVSILEINPYSYLQKKIIFIYLYV